MSKWITDEANAHNDRIQRKDYEKRLIENSNYWVKLVRTVELDVAQINEHPYWKPILANLPLQFGQETGGTGYQVSKSGYPSVMVKFRNDGRNVVIDRGFIDNEEVAGRFDLTEELLIGTSGNSVVLHAANKRSFVTFEDASQYILKPIIETLKSAKENEL